MPSHKDLLELIRQGKSPEEIYRAMSLRPSHWRRMIAGKRFQDALGTREELAAVLAVHRISSGVHMAAGRFTELLDSQNVETVRKVCLAFLNEGLHGERGRPGEDSQYNESEQPSQPWELLKPANPPGTEPDAEGLAVRSPNSKSETRSSK